MKKFFAVILAAAIACSLTACGSGTDGGQPGKKQALEVGVFNGGYGLEWVEKIADAYELSHKGTKITIKETIDQATDLSKIEAGLCSYDVFFTTLASVNKYGVKGFFKDLNSVYEGKPENDLTVEEKLGTERAKNYKVYNGNYYSLPFADSVTGIAYNKTVLDGLFAGSSYKLPNTTNEFITLAEQIKTKNQYAFVYTLDNEAEYAWWMTQTFVAQMVGYESYVNMLKGKYYDTTSGDYVQDLTGETIYGFPERIIAIQETQKLLNKSSGYVATATDKFEDFAEAQAYFLGKGYGNDKTKACFMVNGDWLYNETEYLQSATNPQDLRMMKFPITSEIVKTFTGADASMTDETLSSIISSIDNDATSSALCSSSTFNKIKEARNMVYSLQTQQVACIPSGCKNLDLAKDFLLFLTSDSASQIYCNALQGCTTPYNTNVTSTATNEYIKSRNEIIKSEDTILLPSYYSIEKFVYSLYPNYTFYSEKLYKGEAVSHYNSSTYKNNYLTGFRAALITAGIIQA